MKDWVHLHRHVCWRAQNWVCGCVYGLETFCFHQSNNNPGVHPPLAPKSLQGREHSREGMASLHPPAQGTMVPSARRSPASSSNQMRITFPSPNQTRPDFCHDMKLLIGCSLCFSRQKSICSTHTKHREHRCLRRDQNHHSVLRCGRLSPNKQSFNSPGALHLVIHVRKDDNESYTLLPKTGMSQVCIPHCWAPDTRYADSH